jgi:hypothetical protein
MTIGIMAHTNFKLLIGEINMKHTIDYMYDENEYHLVSIEQYTEVKTPKVFVYNADGTLKYEVSEKLIQLKVDIGPCEPEATIKVDLLRPVFDDEGRKKVDEILKDLSEGCKISFGDIKPI